MNDKIIFSFVIICCLSLASAVMFPLDIWIFGDDDLCDDYPTYKASKPSYCYLSGSDENYDYELDTCADGYYNSWISNWNFVCATEQQAFDRCMKSYPSEYMVKDGNLYQRTIELDPHHVVCATRIMDGVPLDIDKFIEERESQNFTRGIKE